MEKIKNTGAIVQVIGPVVDVQFYAYVPKIYEKLTVSLEDTTIVLEVEGYLDDGIVRTIPS